MPGQLLELPRHAKVRERSCYRRQVRAAFLGASAERCLWIRAVMRHDTSLSGHHRACGQIVALPRARSNSTSTCRLVITWLIGKEGYHMTKWNFEADFFTACNCDWGCPCNFNA